MLAQILHRLVRVQQMQTHQIYVQRELVEIIAANGDKGRTQKLVEQMKAAEESLKHAMVATTEITTTASGTLLEIADELVASRESPEVIQSLAGKVREVAAALGSG